MSRYMVPSITPWEAFISARQYDTKIFSFFFELIQSNTIWLSVQMCRSGSTLSWSCTLANVTSRNPEIQLLLHQALILEYSAAWLELLCTFLYSELQLVFCLVFDPDVNSCWRPYQGSIGEPMMLSTIPCCYLPFEKCSRKTDCFLWHKEV